MLISSSLPSPLKTSRQPLVLRQRHTADLNKEPGRAHGILSEASKQKSVSPDQATYRPRFVMPGNATSRSGQMALREYQMIQNEGGPELVNRIDVRV